MNTNSNKSFLTYCVSQKMNFNADASVEYKTKTVSYTGFGYGCDVTADYGLAVGAFAYVCEPHGIALGPYTRVKHENSVVIGQHIESKNPNSVLICDAEFKNGSISIEDDKLLILGNNINSCFKCEGCDDTIKSGVRWSSEILYQASEPGEPKSGLCFNCIRDCVLQFRAKESWANEFGDPISELKKEVQELKEKMKKHGMH